MPNLLWTIAAILFVMWLLGFALHFTLGGLLHILLGAGDPFGPPPHHHGSSDRLKGSHR